MSGPRVKMAVSSAGVAFADGGAVPLGVAGMGASEEIAGPRLYPSNLEREVVAGGGTARAGRVG